MPTSGDRGGAWGDGVGAFKGTAPAPSTILHCTGRCCLTSRTPRLGRADPCGGPWGEGANAPDLPRPTPGDLKGHVAYRGILWVQGALQSIAEWPEPSGHAGSRLPRQCCFAGRLPSAVPLLGSGPRRQRLLFSRLRLASWHFCTAWAGSSCRALLRDSGGPRQGWAGSVLLETAPRDQGGACWPALVGAGSLGPGLLPGGW